MKVDEILRLALLVEHGGLMVRLSEALVVGELHWIEQEFALDEVNTEVLLFAEKNGFQPKYKDFVFAVKKGAQLINETFDVMCEVIATGNYEFNSIR